MAVNVVSISFFWCSTGCLGVHSARCWLSLRILSASSLDPDSSVPKWPLRPDVAFPTTSRLQLSASQLARRTQMAATATGTRTQLSYVQFVGLILPSNTHTEIWTRLHASAISSDIWRSGCVTSTIFGMALWSSSSGNKCHAVQRSLSSGASLCSGTVGPSPCPILSALIRPRDLFRLLAIGMCHFRPVHHLGIAFLGRVEGQNITI